ncbi:MAG: hypothetical protein JWP44_4372 [Mucilaginibacter sp.]|nr:hypothetical protein [Mucilaginibacter sp.]
MIDGTFRICFEYVAPNGDTIRSEHPYGPAFLALVNRDSVVAKKAAELCGKVINAMKEDGTIPPPTNVLRVDFQKRKLVAA